MMTLSAENFICVNCDREQNRRWWNSRDRRRSLPPLCPYCEGVFTKGVREPSHGAFMDRRNAMRLAAIADALHVAASAKQWREEHGCA